MKKSVKSKTIATITTSNGTTLSCNLLFNAPIIMGSKLMQRYLIFRYFNPERMFVVRI